MMRFGLRLCRVRDNTLTLIAPEIVAGREEGEAERESKQRFLFCGKTAVMLCVGARCMTNKASTRLYMLPVAESLFFFFFSRPRLRSLK